MNLEADAYEEIVRRLVSLRDTVAELSEAYDDPVARSGAQEMRESLDRVLELLGPSTPQAQLSAEPARAFRESSADSHDE